MKQQQITKKDEEIFAKKVNRFLKKTLKKNGVDPSKFDGLQIDIIYLGIKDGLDISKYSDPKFSYEQMESIYGGLKEGLNVLQYANPKYTCKKMESIRERLAAEKKHLNEAPDKATQSPSLPF